MDLKEKSSDVESSNGDVDSVNWELEKRLLRKLDWTLIPLFMTICESLRESYDISPLILLQIVRTLSIGESIGSFFVDV